MYALDFEYDNQCLSDYGFMICDFENKTGANIVSTGVNITLNTVSRNHGMIHSLTSAKYDSCIQASFDICKNPDVHGSMLKITNEEYRDLMRWLNRKEYLPFQFIREGFYEYDACFYNATFNVNKIEVGTALVGLRLNMVTNMPFGYGVEQYYVLHDGDNTVYDMNDEIGYTYPNLHIVCKGNGDLHISNATYSNEMVIKNCSYGEEITIFGSERIILSSIDSHAIYDDFNYRFLYIGNDATNRTNEINVTLPCEIELRYTPIIKDTP